MKGVTFVNRRYTEGVPFLKNYILKGKGLDLGAGYPSHCDMAAFQTGPSEPRPRWRENITLPRPLVH